MDRMMYLGYTDDRNRMEYLGRIDDGKGRSI